MKKEKKPLFTFIRDRINTKKPDVVFWDGKNKIDGKKLIHLSEGINELIPEESIKLMREDINREIMVAISVIMDKYFFKLKLGNIELTVFDSGFKAKYLVDFEAGRIEVFDTNLAILDDAGRIILED